MVGATPELFLTLQYQRPGSQRTALNAELTAEYLVREGIFSHERHTYLDREAQTTNNQAWKKIVNLALPTFVKYVIPQGKTTFGEARDTIQYVSLSQNYEFHIDDVVSSYI
jgi:hypothetical protein